MSDIQPAPISEILEAGRSGEQPAAPERVSPPPQASDPTSDASPDRTPDEKSWSYKAYKEERAKRQQFAARVRELEEENRALLTTAVEREAPANGYGDDADRRALEFQHQINYRVARAEALATHGADTMAALVDAVGRAYESGHPDLPMVRDIAMRSDDPFGVIKTWAEQAGLLQQPQAQQRRTAVMPSNFAGARNVGVRSGPAWSGPQSVSEIFGEHRAAQKGNIFRS
jgi:hypothetical protein